jgi:hypothetical protein
MNLVYAGNQATPSSFLRYSSFHFDADAGFIGNRDIAFLDGPQEASKEASRRLVRPHAYYLTRKFCRELYAPAVNSTLSATQTEVRVLQGRAPA